MTQLNITIYSNAHRERAAKWAKQSPLGTRIAFKSPKRTIPQNDRMWAMLTDVATQKEHAGRKYTPDQWKILFMHGCGRETQFIPSLDNSTFIPWGQSSSDLSVQEMSDLIEFMMAWGIENGVKFGDKSPEAERVMSELRQRKPRVKDEKHLTYIRAQPCCLCGDNIHVEAAHIRAGSTEYRKPATGMGEKPDDRWTLPLCGKHHREQHTMNEMEFWAMKYGIDPFALARTYQPQPETTA